MLRPKLVFYWPTSFRAPLSLLLLLSRFGPCLKRHGVFYASAIPEVTRYEPLYNNDKAQRLLVCQRGYIGQKGIYRIKGNRSVVYWPTTRPGCQNRKLTYVNNRCIRPRNIRIITLTVDGLNECNRDAHKKVDVELLYNSVKTGSQ